MRHNVMRMLVLILLITTLTSCGGGDGESTDAGTPPVRGGDTGGGDQSLPYDGPPVTFTVAPGDDRTQFNWSVTVPTGGWELVFEGASTHEDHALIRAALTRPGPDEIVTQALETLTGDYENRRRAFSSAELLITIRTRGEQTPDDYRVAATWP